MFGLTGWKKEILDWVLAIVIAIVAALFLRTHVLTLVKVQGTSMTPTLEDADRLYINKVMYTPKRGDVVVFTPASDPDRPYIKRVIAIEGDTVYIDYETSTVYVNGEEIDEPYIKEPTRLIDKYISDLMVSGNYSMDNPIVIEEGMIFAMGDNRNNSKDSRALGPIPVEEIDGVACFRFWPLSKFGAIPGVD